MSKEAKSLKVPRSQGQTTISLTNRLGIVNRELEIHKNNDYLYIPLFNQPSDQNLKIIRDSGINFEITTSPFRTRRTGKESLISLLERKLPPHLLASLPRSLDIIGDIAIVELPRELEAHKKLIGETLLKLNKHTHTVLAKAGAVTGTYRTRELDFLAGEQKTETTHKENGCQYKVDITKTYFSPRLSHEHKRVALLVNEGETVVDMFAGVGPFAILIGKTHINVRVYAIDVNPDAVKYLKTNIRLNRVIDKIHPFAGDARRITDEKLAGVADRVIMNLPEKSIEFVQAACRTLKPIGGIVHFYSFTDASTPLDSVKLLFTDAVEKSRRKVDRFLDQRKVRETAPYESQIVIDARVT